MTSQRQVTTDTGEMLDKEHNDSFISYDNFQGRLLEYKNTEDAIIKNIPESISTNTTPEMFSELVKNFRGKEKLIRKSMNEVDKEIKRLSIGSNEPKSYQTELNKLEIRKLETFKWLLQQEFKREELNKQEALKKFMALCVNNVLAPEAP